MFLNTAWVFFDWPQKLHFTFVCPRSPKGLAEILRAFEVSCRLPEVRYTVYTCFCVCQGSQCAIYTPFCVVLGPQRPARAPQKTNTNTQGAESTAGPAIFYIWMGSRPRTPTHTNRSPTEATDTCFYVFQGSQCAIYMCFCMSLGPQRLPRAPRAQKEAQQRPRKVRRVPESPSRAPPEHSKSALKYRKEFIRPDWGAPGPRALEWGLFLLFSLLKLLLPFLCILFSLLLPLRVLPFLFLSSPLPFSPCTSIQ